MTEGQKKLRAQVWPTDGTRGITEREVAQRCRVSQPAVSDWLNGKSRPMFGPRVAMESFFDIDLGAWDRDADAEQAATTAERRTG